MNEVRKNEDVNIKTLYHQYFPTLEGMYRRQFSQLLPRELYFQHLYTWFDKIISSYEKKSRQTLTMYISEQMQKQVYFFLYTMIFNEKNEEVFLFYFADKEEKKTTKTKTEKHITKVNQICSLIERVEEWLTREDIYSFITQNDLIYQCLFSDDNYTFPKSFHYPLTYYKLKETYEQLKEKETMKKNLKITNLVVYLEGTDLETVKEEIKNCTTPAISKVLDTFYDDHLHLNVNKLSAESKQGRQKCSTYLSLLKSRVFSYREQQKKDSEKMAKKSMENTSVKQEEPISVPVHTEEEIVVKKDERSNKKTFSSVLPILFCNQEFVRYVSTLPMKEQCIVSLYCGFVNGKHYSVSELSLFLEISKEEISHILIYHLEQIKKQIVLSIDEMLGELHEEKAVKRK